MQDLGPRGLSILGTIMQDPFAATTVQTLSRKLGVSERTIRYDVAALSDWLGERGVTLSRVPHRGILVDPSDVGMVMDILAENDSPKPGSLHNLSNAQRSGRIIMSLLEGDCPPTTETIAERFGVSKTTAARDIRIAKAWFESQDTPLVYSPKKGWHVEVSEHERRQLMVKRAQELLGANMSPVDLAEMESGAHADPFSDIAMFWEPLGRCSRESMPFLRRRGERLTDPSFVNFCCYLAAAVTRTSQGFHAYAPLEAPCMAVQDVCLDMLDLLRSLGVDGTESELTAEASAAESLLQALPKMSAPAGRSSDFDLSSRITSSMMTALSSSFGCDLFLDDELASALRLHIEGLVARQALGVSIRNDVLDEVKSEYPGLYAQCRDTVIAALAPYNILPSDDEVGYIAVYVGAAMERFGDRAPSERAVRVCLVCGAGVGTTTFLSRALMREYPKMAIRARLSAQECMTHDYSDVDLIITTIAIPRVLPRPVIRVTPMLSRTDLRRIEAFLRFPAGGIEESALPSLMGLIRETCQINDLEALESGLRRLIGPNALPDGGIASDLPRLEDLISEGLTRTGVEVSSWEEAVAIAAEPLLASGQMTEDYYTQIFDFSKQLEQYGVILAPICAPHAEPDQRNRAAISIVTLRNDVTVLLDGEEVSLNVFFLLCLKTPAAHVAALNELFCLIDEFPRFAQDLRAAASPSALIRTLVGYCRQISGQ